MTAHAELGASAAHRWMPCPGSIRESRGIPGRQSEHSRAGTAAHEVGAMALNKGVDPDMWLGLTVEGVVVDEEMVDAVRVYTEHCRALMAVADHYGIEEKFSLAALNPPAQMFGTTDFWCAITEVRTLEIVDYKNGSGVVVEVKGNKQTRYYALGAFLSLPPEIASQIDKIVMTIIQPRAAHPDGVVRSETIDVLELIEFAGELMEAARATLDPNAPLRAGSHCRFCPASATCPEQREQVQALAQVAFSAMPLDVPPAPESLPDEVFADILSKLPILEEWAKSMRAAALHKLENGGVVPGFKLVAKRATRKWKNEAEALTMLQDVMMYSDDELYEKKLKSPAQIEKLTGKKAFPSDFVEKRSSGYTLAPDHDARPALPVGASEAFAALPPASD